MMNLACDHIEDSPTLSEAVGSFATMAEGAADLGVHRLVDGTVDTLLAEAKFFKGTADLGAIVLAKVASVKPTSEMYIDPDGQLDDILESIIDRYESYLAVMSAKKADIDLDGRLHESHCDMLHSAYDELLNAIARFIDTTKDIAACMARHDVAAAPRDGKVFATVDELEADLLS
jgi:hypothetical protein